MEHSHAESHDRAYLIVFFALLVLTVISFSVAESGGSRALALLVVLSMATVKALLVAAIFMHLRIDIPKLYVILVPAMVLSVLLVVALIPDVARAPSDVPHRAFSAAAAGASSQAPFEHKP